MEWIHMNPVNDSLSFYLRPHTDREGDRNDHKKGYLNTTHRQIILHSARNFFSFETMFKPVFLACLLASAAFAFPSNFTRRRVLPQLGSKVAVR
jgi:hypothetical protein